MPKDRLIIICQSGGKFSTSDDGSSLSYGGGDAHAIGVTRDTRFNEFNEEIADMWRYNPDSIILKYFLPGNNKTLITISSDKDIQRLLDFHEDADTVDVYVLTNENHFLSDVSTVPCSRSSRTTVAEPVEPLESPLPADSDLPNVPENFTDTDEQYSPAGNFQDIRQHKLTASWRNCITGPNQQFNSVYEFRDALRKYSMAHGFAYTCKKNDFLRVTAKCKADGCPWRVHASRLSTTQLFLIKKMNAKHTCGAGTSFATQPYASKKLVASIIKEKLRDTPNCRPKELADQIRQDFGIELKYSQAYRGMESARQELHGSYKSSYSRLPRICSKILETNPGSVATLCTREDMTFHRMFVAFYASLHGFCSGCRPLLFLDAVTLISKYPSQLMTATALDGNDCVFPVAFAVVDAADESNWYWFLVQMKSCLSISQPITFVTNRETGLKQSISTIFENSFHAYCLHHLMEDLKASLKGQAEEVVDLIVGYFCDAAFAATFDAYRKCLENIKAVSVEAYEWIARSEPDHWANALFKGSRYNNMTSKVAESFYKRVTDVSMLPVVQIIDIIRRDLTEMICTRRLDSDRWSSRLTLSVEDKLQKEIIKAQSLQVLLSSSRTFEVHDDLGSRYLVNIDIKDCSCKMWQITGFPCAHAIVVIAHTNGDVYDFCSSYFNIDVLRETYSESISPVPLVESYEVGDSSPVQVLPPQLPHATGQPKKRRLRNKEKIKRPLHCSRCKGVGHNRATCHLPS